MGQALAFVGVGIWIVVSSSPSPSTPIPADALGFWGTMGWSLELAMSKLAVPLGWYLNTLDPIMEKLLDIWTYNIFTKITFLPIYLFLMLFFGIPFF